MPERLLFITGKLAEPSLLQVLQAMQPTEFTYEVHQLGISVAGLMTTDMVRRRLKNTFDADKILLPGRCRGDVGELSRHFGILVERGPDELKDLPAYFGKEGKHADLSCHDVSIFAEIVDAPRLSVGAIIERAERYRNDGADVIDLGCLPEMQFGHLEESVQALKDRGFRVSVDTLDPEFLVRAGKAGADYLLSLNEETLWVADAVDAVPVLIPREPHDSESLYRAMESLANNGKRFIADSVLDPIHFGFTQSIVRYQELKKRYPEAEVMMGIGNLTELTEADTNGIIALLMGMISELQIRHILITEVSRHCVSAVRESDLARRIMYRARADHALPKQIHGGLTAIHERQPFPYSADEIMLLAREIRDPSYRIHVSDVGIHLFNRDGIATDDDPFQLFPNLDVKQDVGHAFYLGVELARAQIAYQLGKRYVQDEELQWGCAVPPRQDSDDSYTQPGSTFHRPGGRK